MITDGLYLEDYVKSKNFNLRKDTFGYQISYRVFLLLEFEKFAKKTTIFTSINKVTMDSMSELRKISNYFLIVLGRVSLSEKDFQEQQNNWKPL